MIRDQSENPGEPAPSTVPQPSGNAKSRRMLLSVLCLPALVLLAFMAWPYVRQRFAQKKLEAQIETLRERGIPVDDESMTQFRDRLAPATNAQRWVWVLKTFDEPAYGDAVTGLPIVGDVNFQPPAPGEPWDYEPEMTAFLSDWRDFREELHSIAEGSGPVRVPLEFDSLQTLLTYVQASHSAARLLVLEHQFAVAKRDDELCADSLLALIGVVRSLEFEPIMITQIERFKVMDLTHTCLQRTLHYNLLSDQQLLQIDAALSGCDGFTNSFNDVVTGERAMLVAAFQDPEISRLMSWSGQQKIRDMMTCLSWYESATVPETALSDVDAFLDLLNQQQERIDQEILDTEIDIRYDEYVEGLPFPDLVRFGKATVRQELNLRLARLAIAVRRYENQFGRWPDSPANLQEIGVDESDLRPSGGKPFGYRVTGNEAILWGFSPNSSRDQTPTDPPALKKIEFSESKNASVWKLLP